MNRRKFVIGLGAASASGSALIGSGAFTSVSAERDIAVSTAGDDEAFLRLGPATDDNGDPYPNGAYVDQGEDGLFSISLSGDNGSDPPAGSGVNQNAVSRFDNVFEICNQGTQSICVDFAVDLLPIIPNGTDVPEGSDFSDGDLAVTFYRGDDPDDPINVDDLNADRDGAFPMEVGDCQRVGIEVRAFGFETDTDLFDDSELQIVADADADCSGEPEAPEENPTEPEASEVIEYREGVNSNGNEIDSDRTDPSAALGNTSEFVSLGFRPEGADDDSEWHDSGGGRLVVGFEEELNKRPFGTDLLAVETTGGRDNYPEEKALVEVEGPETDGFVEVGTATSEASDGRNTFELPAEPIEKVRLTDKTDRNQNWTGGPGDGFDVEAIRGYAESETGGS